MKKLDNKKKKQVLIAVVLGLISILSYIIVLTNQEYVTEKFTKGGWYMFLPVAAAFYFSFLHGAFANNVLSIFGITASKKIESNDEE